MTEQTPAFWTMTGTFDGQPITLEAHATRYAHNDRLAILLHDTDDAELFADLSINVPQVQLVDEQRQIIIDHNVTAEILAMAIDSGLLHDTPDTVVSFGMATSHVYSLTPQATQWAADTAPAGR